MNATSIDQRATEGEVAPGRVNLVLLRHGASTANDGGFFGGWDDVPLIPRGVDQARDAGNWLKAHGFRFEVAFASVLRRAITTAWHTLDALDQSWIPLSCDWRLNERHYGALQGMKKVDAVAKYGATRVHAWRRGFDERPPCVNGSDARACTNDPRYRALLPGQFPCAESLADTVARVAPCWHQLIAPRLQAGDRVLVVAHGNSIRALLVLLLRLDSARVREIEVTNAAPLLFATSPSGAVIVRVEDMRERAGTAQPQG